MTPSPPAEEKSPIGADAIRAALRHVPTAPGVYRMLDAKGTALYVGKAKQLKNRVTSYINTGALSYRIARMVSQVVRVETTTTRNEAEALLLEANLIKKLAPRYNILLRDDKSFPFIFLSGDHAFPQITKHRGNRKRKGDYFGPFASAGAVNDVLTILQRAFLLRPCSDTVFAHRSRPCLQYQIKRCSAPCVDKISDTDYGDLVAQAKAFLSGKNREIQQQLTQAMQAASEVQAYEQAAMLRDRIRALTQVQNEQALHAPSLSDADVIALHREGGSSTVQIFFFRGGQNFGNRAYFPSHTADATDADIITAFLTQFYAQHTPPHELLLSHAPADQALLEEAIRESSSTKPEGTQRVSK